MSFNCKSKDGKSYSINWVKVKDAYVPSSVVCSQRLNINLQKKPKDKLPKCPAGLVCKETLDPNSVLKIGNYNLTLSNYFDTNYPVYKYSLKNYKENSTFRIPGNQNFVLRVTSECFTAHPVSQGSLITFNKASANGGTGTRVKMLGLTEELTWWDIPEIPNVLPPEFVVGVGNYLFPRCPCTSVGVGGSDSWCNDPECCIEDTTVTTEPVDVEINMGITIITQQVCPDQLDPPEAFICPVVKKDNIGSVRPSDGVIFQPDENSKCYCNTEGEYVSNCLYEGGCVCVSCEECVTTPRVPPPPSVPPYTMPPCTTPVPFGIGDCDYCQQEGSCCPNGCCPEPNWVCCPDGLRCVATCEECFGGD